MTQLLTWFKDALTGCGSRHADRVSKPEKAQLAEGLRRSFSADHNPVGRSAVGAVAVTGGAGATLMPPPWLASNSRSLQRAADAVHDHAARSE
jgi:hypothetical protein